MSLTSTIRTILTESFKNETFFESDISRIMRTPKPNKLGSDFQRRVSHA